MIDRKLVALAMVLASSLPSHAVVAAAVRAAFDGRWRIAGVAVPDTGVQALANNDPSLMGRELSFSPGLLAWTQPPQTRDICIGPKFVRLPSPTPVEMRSEVRRLGLLKPMVFSISCRSGTWGPSANATILMGSKGDLAMPWYDGALLKLVRQ